METGTCCGQRGLPNCGMVQGQEEGSVTYYGQRDLPNYGTEQEREQETRSDE